MLKVLFSILFLFKTIHAEASISNNPVISSENSNLDQKLKLKFTKNKDLTKEILNQYLKEKGYYTSDVSKEDGAFRISTPIKWDIFFQGAEKYTNNLLKKLIIDSTFTPKKNTFISELKNLFLDFYRKEGFAFIEIDIQKIKTSSKFKEKLLVKIKEHNKVRLGSFKISGDTGPYNQKQLVQKLKYYSGPPISNGFFSSNTLESGVQSLRNDLKNLGYFSSKLFLSDLFFNKFQTYVDTTYTLQLGDPTVIEKVNFLNVKESEKYVLEALLGLSPGSVLNLYTLEEGLKLIEDYYLSRGFLRVAIPEENIVTYSEDLKQATLNINILENVQTIVDHIEIIGLQKTKEYVVLKELAFEEGEVLTLDKLEESNKKLQNLGIFSNIKIRPVVEDEDNKKQKVLITLKERKSGSFVAGAGINTELGLTAKTFVGVNYNNLWGTARSFSSQLELRRNLKDIDYLENRVFLSYTEPYFIGKDIDAKVNLSRNDEIWFVNRTLPEDQVTLIESNRIDFILESQITKHTKLSFYTFTFDLRNESEIDNKFPEINEFIASFGPVFEIDYRDRPYAATKGSLTELQIEYATPLLGSNTRSRFGEFDLEYFKIQSSFSTYHKLQPNLILAQAFRGGYLYNFANGDGSTFNPFPKSRAFFLGGATTIRGFDPSRGNERIPNDAVLQASGLTVQGQTLGGGLLNIPTSSHYYLSKTELRFPLTKNSNFWGAIFYDGGSVQIDNVNANFDAWRHSVGFGVRYNTPLGPLFNIEFAYKLDRKSEFNETAAQVHLSVASF